VQEKTYDVVLMDLQMPGMDGLEASLAIRRLGGPYTALPIIALTSNISAEVKAQSLSVGMSDFLTKPYRQTDLFRVLTRFCKPHPWAVARFPNVGRYGLCCVRFPKN
jgi:CheY-like chemotaxis protein